MKKQPARSTNPPLATGQLWQMKNGYVHIAGVGKTLVDYKLMRKPGQRGTQPQMGSRVNVLAYLKANQARLVVKPAEPSNQAPSKARQLSS